MEAFAPLGTITLGGKTYPFAPYDALGVRAMYKDWMLKEAWGELQALRPVQGPDEFQKTVDGFRRDVSAKLYNWGTEVWGRFFDTSDGQKNLVRFQLTVGDTEKRTDINAVVEQIYALPREGRSPIVNHMFDWAQDPNLRGAAGKTQPSDPLASPIPLT